MSDLITNFANNAHPGRLTAIGAGIGQIIAQKRAQEAETSKLANYQAILGQFNETKDPSLIPQLQSAYPEKFEGFKKSFDAMTELQRKNVVQSNMEVLGALGAGLPELAVSKKREISEAYETSGDKRQAKIWAGFADITESGNSDPVEKYLTMITGVSPEGQKALTSLWDENADTRAEAANAREAELQPGNVEAKTLANEKTVQDMEIAAGKYATDQIVSSAQILKTMQELKITDPKERARLGEAMEGMPLSYGKQLTDLISITGLMDTKDMTPTEFGNLVKSLRTEYYDDTESFRAIDATNAKMDASLSQDSSQGDVGALFLFMKMLDENSVVRESEFRTASQMGSLLDTLKNTADKWITGQRLQPEQKENLSRLTKEFYKIAEEKRKPIDDRMRRNTTFFNVPEGLVFLDYDEAPTEVEPVASYETKDNTLKPVTQQTGSDEEAQLRAHVAKVNEGVVDANGDPYPFDTMPLERLKTFHAAKSFVYTPTETAKPVNGQSVRRSNL